MFINNNLYNEDIQRIAKNNRIEWERLRNRRILITGASGLIGTFFVDLLMYRNNVFNDNIHIYAMGRNREKAKIRFNVYFNKLCFNFIEQDIQEVIELNIDIDYVIHGASNTHPAAYATEPINTILLSINGTKNILDFSAKHKAKSVLFLSSVEIYGENRGDVERFTEDYCGYIDCNTLRAGYPEGKRAVESLCQAYIKEKSVPIKIARCCRVYGPTMKDDDSKVIAQFLRNARDNESIVLKSKGERQYSYCYVADICSAMLIILFNGENGEAYNIADTNNFSLLEIAKILAHYNEKEIIFKMPSSIEVEGYSKSIKALLNSEKLRNIGWESLYTLQEGLLRTVDILKALKHDKNY
jgi:nucleoside-diphosphate-sugar epimerase